MTRLLLGAGVLGAIGAADLLGAGGGAWTATPAAFGAGEEIGPPVSRDGIAIALPRDWLAVPGGHALLVALAPARDRDESGAFQASLWICRESASGDRGNDRGRVDGAAQQRRIASEIEGYQPIEAPAAVSIHGLEGVRFGGTFVTGKTRLRSRQYLFARDGRLYILTFTALQSRWEAYRPAVESSVATFSARK